MYAKTKPTNNPNNQQHNRLLRRQSHTHRQRSKNRLPKRIHRTQSLHHNPAQRKQHHPIN